MKLMMFDKTVYFIEKHSIKRNVVAGLLFVFFANLVAFPYFPGLFFHSELPMNNMLDLRFGFTAETVMHTLDALNEAGRKAYMMSTAVIDIPYAVAYGFIYSFIMIFIIGKKGFSDSLKYLIFIPFLTAVSDLMENVGILYLLNTWPDIDDAAVEITSIANRMKWSFAALALIAIALLFIFQRHDKNRDIKI